MELHSVALLKPFCCPSWAILSVFIRYWTVRINNTRQTETESLRIHSEVITIVLITPYRWAQFVTYQVAHLAVSILQSCRLWRLAWIPDCSCDSWETRGGGPKSAARWSLSQYTGQPTAFTNLCLWWLALVKREFWNVRRDIQFPVFFIWWILKQ